MDLKRLQNVYFLAILGAVVLLVGLIFWPFIAVIAMAVILALVLNPIYKRITTALFGSKNAGAIVTVLLLLVVIILPLTFVAAQIFQEAQGLYAQLSTSNTISIDQLSSSIQHRVDLIAPGFNINIRAYAATASAWIVSRLGAFFSGTVDFIVKLVISLVALFYFLRDGEKFKAHLSEISPLPEGEDENIYRSLKSSVNSVVVGSIVMAIIQGILGGIGFIVFGVPNPSLWGTVLAVCSFIPGIGTALVWVPATIYLFITHSGYVWVGELIWSFFLVGTIDNFLNPLLLEKGMKIHPILILFSILGGLQFFGPEGVLLGPLVLSLLFALVGVYQRGSGKVIKIEAEVKKAEKNA